MIWKQRGEWSVWLFTYCWPFRPRRTLHQHSLKHTQTDDQIPQESPQLSHSPIHKLVCRRRRVQVHPAADFVSLIAKPLDKDVEFTSTRVQTHLPSYRLSISKSLPTQCTFQPVIPLMHAISLRRTEVNDWRGTKAKRPSGAHRWTSQEEERIRFSWLICACCHIRSLIAHATWSPVIHVSVLWDASSIFIKTHFIPYAKDARDVPHLRRNSIWLTDALFALRGYTHVALFVCFCGNTLAFLLCYENRNPHIMQTYLKCVSFFKLLISHTPWVASRHLGAMCVCFPACVSGFCMFTRGRPS